MYTQNPNPGYYYTPQQNFMYGARPQPRCTQPVTSEMSKLLHQEDDNLSVKISRIDSIKNQCTHKEPGTGQNSLIANADGTFTCRTCGETFHIVDLTKEQVEAVANQIIDIMQTIKFQYVDAPDDFVKEYFQCITLMRNLSKLWEKSMTNFSSYEVYAGNVYPVNNGYNAFQTVNAMMNFNPIGGAPFGAPAYGYPVQQQQAAYGYPAQPPMQPQMGGQPMQAPMQPQWTGAGYIQPQMGGQPMQAPMQPQPGMMENPMAYGNVAAPAPAPAAAPVAAPAAPVAAPAEVQQTKTFAV